MTTSTRPAPVPSLPRPATETDFTLRARLLMVWHALLTLVFLGMLAAVASGRWKLESLPRTVLGILAVLGLALSLLVLWLIPRRVPRARSLSFLTSYLTIVLGGAAIFQVLGIYDGFDDFATAFERTFIWVLVGFIGVIWLVIGRRLMRRTDGAAYTASRFLERAGFVIVGIASALWLWNIDIPAGVRYVAEHAARAPIATVVLLLLVLGGVWASRAMWSTTAARWFNSSSADDDRLVGWLYLSPNLIGFLAFFAGPLVFSLAMSFYKWDGITSAKFVGLSNFTSTLTNPLFWTSMRNVVLFMLAAVPFAVIPALVLAVLINTGYPGTKAYRAVFFIPSVAGVIGVTLIWKQMFNSSVGFINWVISQMDKFINIFLPGDPLPTNLETGWLSDPNVALFAVVIVFAWSQFGFNTVLFTAGLQGISRELYEAAELDGANAWQRFLNVTIPSLRSTTFFVTATTVILCLQVFDIIYALNQPNPVGFPNNATLTPVVYLYQLGFQQDEFGLASAVAWLLFIVIFGLTLLQFRRQRAEAEGA